MDRFNLINFLKEKEYVKDRLLYLEEQKENINKLSASYGLNSGGASSDIQDRLAENLVKILDNYNLLQLDYLKRQESFLELNKLIDKLENPTHRLILFKKYILGYELEQIAVEIHQTYKYTATLHGYALKEFDMICN